MTLDEAIKHAEEVANECTVYFRTSDNEVTQIPSQCAEEHRQLAEWLKELKRVRELPWLKELKALREQKRPHGECNQCRYYDGFHGVQGHAPCSFWGIGGVLSSDYCSRFEKEGDVDG